MGSGARVGCGFAVRDFFRNGGSQAVIVRVNDAGALAVDAEGQDDAKDGASKVKAAVEAAGNLADAKKAAAELGVPDDATAGERLGIAAAQAAVVAAAAVKDATLKDVKDAAGHVADVGVAWDRARLTVGNAFTLVARDPGSWGAGLRARIDTQTPKDIGAKHGTTDGKVFNLRVTDTTTGRTEAFHSVTFDEGTRRLADVLASESSLVRLAAPPGAAPTLTDGNGDRLTDPWQLPSGGNATGYQDKVDDVRVDLSTKAPDPVQLAGFFELWTDKVSAAELAVDVIAAGRAAAERAPGPNAQTIKTNADSAIETAQQLLDDARAVVKNAVSDGGELTANALAPLDGPATFHGLYALAKVDIFNLLVIPPYKHLGDGTGGDVDPDVISTAATFCEQHRAMLIVDPPTDWTEKGDVTKGLVADPDSIGTRSKNAALYFPRIRQPNPLNGMREETFTPSGVIAGVMARTDVARGVWKAPAGLDASLVGVARLGVNLTDGENGELNPRGVNCLRFLPPGRRVVWGARTLEGDDRLASEWKYIPIRRTALFIEESLYRGTQWVVFEPNDEPLWASIRLNVGAFMQGSSGRVPSRAARRARPTSCAATRDTTRRRTSTGGS